MKILGIFLIKFTYFVFIVGARCDVCADNYFGDPEVPGGQCQPCDCTNNIDISRPGNCDARTGECLLCLFNTAGFNCERCRDGFFGDAHNQQCRGKEFVKQTH